jgi:transcriptional regulator with XRE-family HTH domain
VTEKSCRKGGLGVGCSSAAGQPQFKTIGALDECAGVDGTDTTVEVQLNSPVASQGHRFPRRSGPVEFGQEIRRRREANHLTLEQLAERSGLTPNYIGGVETHKRNPSLSTVIAIARGLEVPAGELLSGVEDVSPAAVEAGRLFEEAPSDVQDAVLKLLRMATGAAAKRAPKRPER